MNIAFYILAGWNIAVFLLYGIDKWKASHNRWRIKERTLVLSAFFMGGAGAMLGMYLFRHKTKHMSFKILLPVALLLNAAVIIGIFYLLEGSPLQYGLQ